MMGTQLIRNILMKDSFLGSINFRDAHHVSLSNLDNQFISLLLGGIETSELIDIRQRFNFHLVGDLFAEFKAFAVRR